MLIMKRLVKWPLSDCEESLYDHCWLDTTSDERDENKVCNHLWEGELYTLWEAALSMETQLNMEN